MSSQHSREQSALVASFYKSPPPQLDLTKPQRDGLWNNFKATKTIPGWMRDDRRFSVLEEYLSNAIKLNRNVQSAIFSEYVYTQALLMKFGTLEPVSPTTLPAFIRDRLQEHRISPRFAFRNSAGNRHFIQAGGHAGVDAALFANQTMYNIEYKEAGAKASEVDLPQYSEDGRLRTSDEFSRKYPQYTKMLAEVTEKSTSIWDYSGVNIHDFSTDSIASAINENYNGTKFAHVICTEDRRGRLTMIPSNHIGLWANLEGEIRPAGRNNLAVWTPIRLNETLEARGALVDEVGDVIVELKALDERISRGGTSVSALKFGHVFFVALKDVSLEDDLVRFNLRSVRQLKPTIAAKMFFKDLDANTVSDYYRNIPAV